MNESDFPPLFVDADSASLKGQARHRWIVAANLWLLLIGSVLGFVAVLGGDLLRIASATVSAAVLIAGVLIKWVNDKLRDDENWFEGRAIAETVKSLAWRYMMRIPPYDDDATADAEFTRSIVDIGREGLGKTFVSSSPPDKQITDRMRQIRRLDLPERRTLYADARLKDQVGWYSRKSDFNRERARTWSRISSGAQTFAIVSAVGVIFSESVWLNVVGVFSAVAAAATAWTQLGRHDELTKSYALAAQELSTIEALARRATTSADLIEAVRNGEGAVSREHTMWIAKRGDPNESAVTRTARPRTPTPHEPVRS